MISKEITLSQQDMLEKINKVLLEVNKPSRYIGQEIGSLNKSWNSAIVKTAIAFPDLYEIGISNLGHRILYHIINQESSQELLADRVYAPAIDFKQKLAENQIPLYGVESLMPLSEFDVIAFSLQYELSYPTILAMLEMGQIPIKSEERSNSDPIILAGGPGCFNPESLVDFIDVFVIGDGEEVLIEILNEIKKSKLNKISKEETLRNLQKLEGIYIPKFYKADSEFSRPYPASEEFPEIINKRIASLKDQNYPTNFPVPYSSSVHDRAVIEIRRGCGRMCRFCQSCFVNLPIREREPESIIELTDKVLKNTGYDEYSLLSLSSNDYINIEELVCALNQRYAKTGASISLPSQRADAFSLELANQVQSVRKSTLTFAPEAGSQKLRDVINKNLNEDQILNAVLSAYQAGWNKVKLYFMIGLPTETFEDLDEIINLLQKIKNKANELKRSLNVNKHLDITCTVSIFVPKPFTPFQWCDQDSTELINEKIRYLKEKVRQLKGVKLNFHDSFLSQLEAVFARGDRKLNKLIESVHKKGSYLDAWDEHFNKKIWYQSAEELNICFEEYASRKICLESGLPWDIINVGIDKDWLKKEFTKATNYQSSIPCDEACSNCGVCQSFKKEPIIKSKEQINISSDNNQSQLIQEKNSAHKYRLKLQKTGSLKFISHLDWQRMLYRAVRKAEIKVSFTQGFNPSPKISIGMALPLFVESYDEYLDIELIEEMQENALLEKLNQFLPENSKIMKIVKISKEEKAIDTRINWAKYSAMPIDSDTLKKIDLECIVNNVLSKENIFIEKEKHKGLKKLIDIRPYINFIKVCDDCLYRLEFILMTGQNGTLRPDDFLKFLTPDIKWNIAREKLLDCNFKELL
ncbi:MAG: hypothetical protein A2287_04865 [Candidatus Melainabacteria bacterium RIFOXYA12_FULL_32_12]|nr:MAG: hypothetical protein A2255_06580 [Candidatus Melainabacteria bacterium RIFOXYA2_FULL_32_9]OGI28540.1 MAG: hypothetical protein A2287_04865 [Candidatus Melainabacteria bacterium RIFOXYA12_FULL_32_12]